jgi:hypothetical protein
VERLQNAAADDRMPPPTDQRWSATQMGVSTAVVVRATAGRSRLRPAGMAEDA